MPGFLGQAILQTIVAGLVIEALLRAWRIADPGPRLAFRLLVLLVPFVIVPAFLLLAPWRSTPQFTDTRALFFGGRWASVRLFGLGVDRTATAALAAAGIALFLVDFVPFLLERFSEVEGHRLPHGAGPLTRQVEQLAALMRVRPPRAILAETPLPLLFCSGLRPALVISRATVEALDEEELAAALAHEVAHAAFRDPARGWLLMLARILMCFNPGVQLVARAMVEDMERRADLAAARATGHYVAMARALAKLADIEHGAAPPDAGRPAGVLPRLRRRAIDRRRRALLGPRPDPGPALGWRLALAAVALPWLLFYVV
jgi:Zn-dependent protease with chaperone function